MMTSLSESELDILLRQAEQRLPSTSLTLTAKTRLLLPGSTEAAQLLSPKDKLSVRQASALNPSEKIRDDAGQKWFNLPKTDMTPGFKRDWQILRMRSVLDPKHQKKTLKAEPPKYSQIGEVIAGPSESSNARLGRKSKGRTLLEEAIRTSNKDKLKTKYAGIQKSKSSGKKAYYKKLVQDRRKAR